MRAWRPGSLTTRILLVEGVTILLAALLLTGVTTSLLQSTVDRLQEQNLAEQADAAAASIRVDGGGRWSVILPPALRPLYETGYDGRAFALVDRDGRAVATSRFGVPAVWRRAPRAGRETLFRFGRIVGVSLPIDLGGERGWVIVTLNEGEPGAIVDDVARLFLVRFLGILLGLLLLLPIVNSLAIRRLVKAVAAVSRRAATIGPSSLDARLEEGGLPSEVAPLVHAANGLLERLQASFQVQVEFSANVAHELRTPLATLRAQLDAIDAPDIRGRAIAQVDRMSHVLSQLRDLAALETETSSFRTIDLSTLVIEVIAEAAPRVIAQRHEIAFTGSEGVVVSGNAMLIELALTNLIDNALHHTPPGTRIEVSTAPEGILSVADDGPGGQDADIALMTRRFWRAGRGHPDGAGLGLSIVRRIMDVHGGTLEIAPRAGKGLRFALRFDGTAPS